MGKYREESRERRAPVEVARPLNGEWRFKKRSVWKTREFHMVVGTIIVVLVTVLVFWIVG